MKKILNFIFDVVYYGFFSAIVVVGFAKLLPEKVITSESFIIFFVVYGLIIAILSPFVYFWQRYEIKKLVKQIDEDSEDED